MFAPNLAIKVVIGTNNKKAGILTNPILKGKFAPKYLDPVRSFLTLYIGGLLFVRYNPVTYKDRNFREFDRRLIFTCSIFLLLSTALITGIRRRIEQKAGPIVQDSISDIKDNIGIKA